MFGMDVEAARAIVHRDCRLLASRRKARIDALRADVERLRAIEAAARLFVRRYFDWDDYTRDAGLALADLLDVEPGPGAADAD
tara:strand:- start:3 stop:251 length:249 start_codon:yes stop_codon:yes gene_type:complete